MKGNFLAVSFFFLTAATAFAEDIVLLKDVNANTRHLSVSGTCRAGTKEFLIANDGNRGSELWLGNGLVGTKLIKDIRPGIKNGIRTNSCFPINDQVVFFVGDDGATGAELWRSDGTAAGTTLIKDIRAGTPDGFPNNFTILGNKVLFTANDGINGGELWITDGTEAGTTLVKDIYAGSTQSSSSQFAKLNDTTVIFSANTAAEGQELWRTDGTDGGTTLIQDIRAGANGSNPARLTLFNGLIYFAAGNNAAGTELWVTDGTNGGTSIVKDIYAGANGGVSSSVPFTVLGNKFLFSGITAATGTELFESDGTDANTKLLVEFFPGATSGATQNFLTINNKMFFTARTPGFGQEAWVTNGTAGGTEQLVDIFPGAEFGASTPVGYANEAKSRIVFAGSPQQGGNTELWSTDGTSGGTFELVNLFPGSGQYINLDGGPTSAGLTFGLPAPIDSVPPGGAFLTDGTIAGTIVHPGTLTGFTESSLPSAMGVINSRLIFAADNGAEGYELWSTDGTEAGTTRLTDINTGFASSVSPRTGFAVLNDKLIFVASTSDAGTELWITDGTTAGTALLKDIYPGPVSAFDTNSSLSRFFVLGSTVLFGARTENEGRELWKTDGTPSGTVLVEDINPGTASGIGESLDGLVPDSPQVLFFAADDGTNGTELWVSDGTSGQTQLLSNIAPAGASSNPSDFSKNPSPGTGVAFRACNAATGCEPWFSTGVATSMLKDIVTGAGSSSPSDFRFVSSGKLFFSAYTAAEGRELYYSLGSAMTTNIVKDIGSTTADGSPTYLTPIDSTNILFRACSKGGTDKDCELWRSDGTDAGTTLVKDIASGDTSSDPTALTFFNGATYFLGFSGTDGEGIRVYKTDGTEAGTVPLTLQGNADFSIEDLPTVFTPALGSLFVSMFHKAYGFELFKLGEDQCPSDPNKSIPGICGCGATEEDDDGDGTINCLETCPADQNKVVAGQCGCGVAETDSNANGTADCIEDALVATTPPKADIKITKNKKTKKRKVTITMTAREGNQYVLSTAIKKKGKKKGAPKFKTKTFTSNVVTLKPPPPGSKLICTYHYLLTGTSLVSLESPQTVKKIK